MLTIYRKFGFKDEKTGMKFGIIEMDLADSSLLTFISNKLNLSERIMSKIFQ